MDTIISALIAGGLALIGVIFTNLSNSKQIEQKIVTTQAVTDTKLESLKEEVRGVKDEVKRYTDNFERIPVLEHEVAQLKEDVRGLKSQ